MLIIAAGFCSISNGEQTGVMENADIDEVGETMFILQNEL